MTHARHKSIVLRLTLLFATASTAVLLALGYLIGAALERHFAEQDIDELEGKMQLARHALGKVQSNSDLDALPQHLDDSLIGHHGLSVAVVGPQGNVMFATSGAPFPAPLVRSAAADSMFGPPVVWRDGERVYRGIASRAPIGTDERALALIGVALDISHHEEFMAGFRRNLWLFVLVAAVVTGFLGWIAARRGLSPLRSITRMTRETTVSRLGERLPLDTVPIELLELGTAFNDMFARLDDSFHRLSDFSSDLAHELRTPVSNLMTQTQVALARTRSAEEYREVLYSNLEEYERLARMVADMLFLAKADHGLIVPSREPVQLAREIAKLLEFYELLGEPRSVRLAMTGDAEVMGDRLMLGRAVGNLLSNAIRHSSAGETVHVHIGAGSQSIRVTVENQGETIPAEHLPRLFDRFYRMDPARQHQEGNDGAGLGLAIARSVIRAHGGDIEVSSREGTTRFTIVLPSSGTGASAAHRVRHSSTTSSA